MAAWGWGEPHPASPSSTLDVELDATPPMCPEPDLNTYGAAFHQHAASLELFPPRTRLWRQFGPQVEELNTTLFDFILITTLISYIKLVTSIVHK